jgi:hypothetical protein
MVTGFEGVSRMNAFWHTWRREIIRGAVLFFGVIAIGLCVRYVFFRARQGVLDNLPVALSELKGLRNLRDLGANFDPDLNAGPRHAAETWTYRAKLAPKQWLWIRNANGSVRVEPAAGDSVEITAVKSYGRSDPHTVRLEAVPFEDGVAVCAVWPHKGRPGGESHCGPGDQFKQMSLRRGDVVVDFTVRLPKRVRLGATTVSGDVHVTGATAPLVASTVNGGVDVATSQGPVRAVSVNGDVRARMGAFGDTGEVSLFTVNGSATAELPAQLDATVEASTVNGSIETDYPLEVSGKISKHLKGTLGDGGRKVHITTVNGSINLKKAR